MVLATQQTNMTLVPILNKPFSVAGNEELSQLLRWKTTQLLTRLGLEKSKHYSKLLLRKKSSSKKKFRVIHNPDSLMRSVQFRILKNILEKVPVPDYIHAFEKGRNIPNMAAIHVNKGVVISFDIKDFFPSIKQVHLVKVFSELGFDEASARTLSELCTYDAFLPQGALTSPKLSNIVVALTFGPLVKALADKEGYTLSIYADDLTLSHPDTHSNAEGRKKIWLLKTTVNNILARYGFKINHEKTKVMRPHRRQYVCGVVVNEKLNLAYTERNALRAIIHNLRRNDLEYEAAKNELTPAEFANQVLGRINWFCQVNPEQGQEYMRQFREVVGDMAQINTGSQNVQTDLEMKELKEVKAAPQEIAQAPF